MRIILFIVITVLLSVRRVNVHVQYIASRSTYCTASCNTPLPQEPAETYYTSPRRSRWKQLVPTSWLRTGAISDGRHRRLTNTTGREGPGVGVLLADL
jgi:hypothetical protein